MKAYLTLGTPPGEGGISIIQLSGPGALSLIQKVFRSRSAQKTSLAPGRLYLGDIREQGQRIDEVIVRRTPGRKSLSGLETIEINAHGGLISARRIIRCLTRRGARQILPRQLIELTGKSNRPTRQQSSGLDRIQQEALAGLLSASTPLATEIFLAQYQGALSDKIKKLKNKSSDAIRSELKRLLKTAALGLALNHPKTILLAGRPNTGKSTLFNYLVGRERVITHHRPGTTRDPVEETIVLNEIPFRIIDSAGLTGKKIKGDVIEKMSMAETRRQLTQTDLTLLLFDGSGPPRNQDLDLLALLKNKLFIPVINKIDRPHPKNFRREFLPGKPIHLSALTGQGIARLKQRILKITGLNLTSNRTKPTIFTFRQYQIIKNIIKATRSTGQKKINVKKQLNQLLNS